MNLKICQKCLNDIEHIIYYDNMAELWGREYSCKLVLSMQQYRKLISPFRPKNKTPIYKRQFRKLDVEKVKPDCKFYLEQVMSQMKQIKKKHQQS